MIKESRSCFDKEKIKNLSCANRNGRKFGGMQFFRPSVFVFRVAICIIKIDF